MRYTYPPYGGKVRSSACKRSKRGYPQQIRKSLFLRPS